MVFIIKSLKSSKYSTPKGSIVWQTYSAASEICKKKKKRLFI